MTTSPDSAFLFAHEDLIYEMASLAEALSHVAGSCTSSRNTISFLSYELNNRVETMRDAWLQAMHSKSEQPAAA